MVVVVVIVVVFVKKKLGQQNFDPKTIVVQGTVDIKVLDPKKIWVKIKLGPKSFGQKKKG